MTTIIDSTLQVIASMGLEGSRVTALPGYAGIAVALPNDSQAYFVWSKMDDDDFHFRLARFWQNENPLSMWVSTDLIEAIAKTRVLTNQ